MNPSRPDRIELANELLRLIGSYGRRYFFERGLNSDEIQNGLTDEQTMFVMNDRFAHFALDKKRNGGFIDEKFGYRHELFDEGITWIPKRFSHGNTLRSLVEDMGSYIQQEVRIEPWKIVIPQRAGGTLERNTWGYDIESALALRKEAYKLHIILTDGLDEQTDDVSGLPTATHEKAATA